MIKNDPTDHALAAIAEILDGPAADQARAEPETLPHVEAAAATAAAVAAGDEHGIDGYTRLGPGPLDALRFRWRARRDEQGQYFVDETIGATSRPVSVGPIPRDEVVSYIDQREREARERFEALRAEMAQR